MIRGLIYQESVSADIVNSVSRRDAALWLGPCGKDHGGESAILAELAVLTWQLVLCEENSQDFVGWLEKGAKNRSELERHRGFVSLIARDPEGIQLPPRSLPVLLLNGRAAATDLAESPNPGGHASQRRRLNMTKRLLDMTPQALLVLPMGSPDTVSELRELWNEGLQTRLSIVSNDPQILSSLEEWVASSDGPPSITVYHLGPAEFADELLARFRSTLDTSRLVVRIRTPDESLQSIDVTGCEQPEYPILDRYALICERDLLPIGSDELSEEEFAGFFEKSTESWRPYAAGLPWPRDEQAVKRLLRTLAEIAVEGHEATTLLVIPCEPGAGGTTLAHELAFAAAASGYPTLVAGLPKFEPNSTELSTFLFGLRQAYISRQPGASASTGSPAAGASSEVPSLIVFDAHHWLGREEQLARFAKNLSRESRAAVVLAVVAPEALDKIPSSHVLTDVLQHQITQDQALALGHHLNQYLQAGKRARRPEDWLAFWQNNSPRIGDLAASPASFWVALEFWLKFQLDISESVQSWLYAQYSKAILSDECRTAILTLAAMSLERHTLPETILPATSKDQFPLSFQLEEARRAIPALGLVRATTAASRQWCIGHGLLARYLLNRIFYDRPALQRLGLDKAHDPVELRLILLRRVATSQNLVAPQHRELGVEFAKTILKLDRDGNKEFFGQWREVLHILEEMPDTLWDTSRAFNHHVAISRRRVVNDKDYFSLPEEERVEQLQLAIEHLEYALNHLDADYDDERDLNILNSLARAYQDAADLLERVPDSAEQVKQLREKASAAVRRALSEDPNNSFVLETLARDLLQCRTQSGHERVRRVCEALSFIHRAMSLESAASRTIRLSDLLHRALSVLQDAAVAEDVKQLRLQANPLGNLGCAWLELFSGTSAESVLDISQAPKERQSRALMILRQIPRGARTWMDLRLEYELRASLEPHDYKPQLEIMDELVGSSSHLDIQLRVEYAILLYQCGRTHEASSLFRALRREIADSEAFVIVPERLRVYRDVDLRKPVSCEAIVFDEGGFRSRARIREFGKDLIPFIPRDFGQLRMNPGMRFRCSIVFGPNGPFARPVRT